MKQKAAIVFESEETVVVKRRTKTVIDFCPRCVADVEMMTPEVLSVLVATSEREIFRLIESGEIYFIERNRVLACTGCYRELLTGNVHGDDVDQPTATK